MGYFDDDAYDAAGSVSFFRFEEEGDTLEGEVVAIERDRFGNFGDEDLYRIKTEDGDVAGVSATHTSVLYKTLREANIEIGDVVGLRYYGKAKSKAGRMYKDIRVLVKRGASGQNIVTLPEEVPF